MNVIFSGAMCRNYSHRREQDPTFGGDKKKPKTQTVKLYFSLPLLQIIIVSNEIHNVTK